MSQTSPFGRATQTLDLGHSRVPYYRVGRGPDLVFIHGWPLHSATFRELVPRLADCFTCHLFDLPGTGESEWGVQSKISLTDHAHSVRQIVDQLGLQHYGILAHDSGAVIARLAAAEDARVQGLVLGNTEIAGYRAWQIELFLRIEGIPFGPQLFGLALRLRAVRHASFAYGGCFRDPEFAEGEFRRLFFDPLQRSGRRSLGQRRLLQTLDLELIDRLGEVDARIRAPVHFIWGADDPYFPLARLKPTLPQFGGGASLAVIPSGKLYAHEEFPAQFADEARAFLLRSLTRQTSAVTA